MYTAKILNNDREKIWDDFILTHPLASIHQHSAWGHFQSQIPSRGKYWIIGLYEKEKLIGGTMLIRHQTHRQKTWLYSARGPLLDYQSPRLIEQIQAILRPIKQIAQEENSIFYRLDPPLYTDQPKPKLRGFYTSHLGFQPENTLILNLAPSEENILTQMKPKGRYNIRLAERKNIQIIEAKPHSPEFNSHVANFHKILNETTNRDQFYGHKKQVYHAMITTLSPLKMATLYMAYFNNEPIAGIIVTFFKDTAIYYYGASSNAHRNLMAPYLLQWTAIRDAKARGLTKYDFLGIAPENAKHHAWRGVTDFKLKFGGQALNYQSPREFPFQKLYYGAMRAYKFLK